MKPLALLLPVSLALNLVAGAAWMLTRDPSPETTPPRPRSDVAGTTGATRTAGATPEAASRSRARSRIIIRSP